MMLEDLINKIHHADCLEFMKQLPDDCIDLVLTDPPYGIGNQFTSEFGLQVNKSLRGSFSWNDEIPSEEVFKEIMRVSKKQIIFGGNYYTEILKPTNSWIVWDKVGNLDLKNPFSDCELAWTNMSFAMKKYVCLQMGFIKDDKKSQKIHPTQKPLLLFEKIIADFSKENDLILDCFSGSATTAVACHNLGRRFICIEKEKDYFLASVKRLEDVQKQMTLFGSTVV